jgi:hypothetical protein
MAVVHILCSLDEDLVRQVIVEEDMIPQIIDSSLESQDINAANLLINLAQHDDLLLQMLSLRLLLKLVRSLSKDGLFREIWDTLFNDLAAKAQVQHLIPAFSFLLTELPNESPIDFAFDCRFGPSDILRVLVTITTTVNDVIAQVLASVNLVGGTLTALSKSWLGRRFRDNCYQILFKLFCHKPSLIPVDAAMLSSWRLFFTEVPLTNLNMEIGPTLTKIIDDCSDLRLIIDEGFISSLFLRINHKHDESFLNWFLMMIKNTVTIRPKGEVALFLDHLVGLGLLSFLVDSLTLVYSKSLTSTYSPSYFSNIITDSILDCLQTIFEHDQKYKSQLMKTSFMSLLLSSTEKDSDSESISSDGDHASTSLHPAENECVLEESEPNHEPTVDEAKGDDVVSL